MSERPYRRTRRAGTGLTMVSSFSRSKQYKVRTKCELGTVCYGGADATHVGTYPAGRGPERNVRMCDQCLMAERLILVDWHPILAWSIT